MTRVRLLLVAISLPYFVLVESLSAQGPREARTLSAATSVPRHISMTAAVVACTVDDDCALEDVCLSWSCTDGVCAYAYVDTCPVEGPCDDGNECTEDCGCTDSGMCVYPPWRWLKPCPDSDPCTVNERCEDAVCVTDNPCDDKFACTLDACEPGAVDPLFASIAGYGCSYDRSNCACDGVSPRPDPVELSVDLSALVGEYPVDVSREAEVTLPTELYEVDSVVFDWTGGVELGDVHCTPDNAVGMGLPLEVAFVDSPGASISLGTGIREASPGFVPFEQSWAFPPEAFPSILDGVDALAAQTGLLVVECPTFDAPVVLLDRAELIVRGYRLYDADCDGVVAAGDLRRLTECTTGPLSHRGAGCERFDADRDSDVDLHDVSGFLGAFD